MKKVLLITILTISFTVFSHSQVLVGVSSGLNISSTSSRLFWDEYSDPDNSDIKYQRSETYSINGGVYLKYSINDFIGIRSELSYANKAEYNLTSIKVDNSDSPEYFSTENRFHYLDIPITLSIGKTSGLVFDLGIAPSFIINGKTLVWQDKEMVEVDFKRDLFNKTDLGLVAQIGYEFKFGLNINARYIHGLNELYNEPLSDDVTKFHCIQANIGYTINKKSLR